MADPSFTNGSVDAAKPVPVIGLYIAGASAICMLMMLWDIGAGIFAQKRWLPCKKFKLDSVTLTLLGIAAKLPVDLTSSMPSSEDQLSKLTGTVLICMCMAFLAPSLGFSNESESFTNLVALSIFVITVAANICIQLRTGVMVLFYTEHIIIICFMLVLLMLLWHIWWIIGSYKKITADQSKALLAKPKGNDSMIGRLKVCYLYSYCSNPQFKICSDPTYASISIVSLICSFILVQAAVRSVIFNDLKLHSGHSDYGWSVPSIIVTQMLTIIVAALAIVFRLLTLFRRMDYEKVFVPFLSGSSQSLGKWYKLRRFFLSLSLKTSSAAQLVILTLPVLIRNLLCLEKTDALEYFHDLPHDGVIAASDYIVRKSVNDIIKLREACTKKSVRDLWQFLSQTNVSEPTTLLHTGAQNSYEPCFTSVALQVKFAQVSLPEEHQGCIVRAFKESNEILYFIDKTLQTNSSDTKDTLSYVKAVLTDIDFSYLLPAEVLGMRSAFHRAVIVIEKLEDILKSDSLLRKEVSLMIKFINRRSCQSIEELSSFMKQMFTEMVCGLFRQLPIAIYTSLSGSSTEDFEGRMKQAMTYLFQIELTGPLDDQIYWKFPTSYIVSLIEDKTNYMAISRGPLGRLQELIPTSPVQVPIQGVEVV